MKEAELKVKNVAQENAPQIALSAHNNNNKK